MKLNLLLVTLLLSLGVYAQIPVGYYNSATGSGFILKTQLHNIIDGHINQGYSGLWTTYATSDRDNQYENDNTIIDLYSENPSGPDPVIFQYITNQCGNYVVQGDCYNREHIVPQSIYNSASPMVSDAHFVIPVDGYVNGMRSNNPHGNVGTATWTSLNGGKRGSSAVAGYSGTVFEPLDEFKGDIARMYFYFATRYENTVASYTSYPMFNGTATQVFATGFLNMLITWHNQDPVSAREIARNNAIYLRQNNRNPFIDNPQYVAAIWIGTSAPGPQTITFNALSNVVFGSGNFNLTATANSNLPVTYSSSNTNVATVLGNVVTLVGVGTTNITASQAGNSSYLAAPNVVQPLTVTQASQTITFASLPNKVESDAPFTLVATGGSSGNPVTFTSSNSLVATVIGNLVTIVGIGTTNITASQIGNTNYSAASNVVRSLTVVSANLLAWDFSSLPGGTGVNNFGPSPYNATYSNPNITATGLLRGVGIVAASTSNAAARAWGGTVNTATTASAISSNTSITFTLKSDSGYALDLNAITPIDYRRSPTGATNALVQYSVNGNIFTDIATLNFTSSSSSGASAGSINLSMIAALQNLHASSTVTIRILPYGGTGGTFYLFDRLVSNGYDFGILGKADPCATSGSSSSLTISSVATPYSWNGQSLSSSGVFTSTFINSFGCDSIVTLNLTVLPNIATLNLKAFIQGCYQGASQMSAILYDAGISSDTMACDSVVVELRQALFPYANAYSVVGPLNINGLMLCNFSNALIGNSYYIVVKNRNALETWSALPILFGANTSYDFTTAASKAYNNNLIEVEPNVFAIYSGDITQDGVFDNNDFSLWELDANNFQLGYIVTDFDGNLQADNADFSFWEANSNNFIVVEKP